MFCHTVTIFIFYQYCVWHFPFFLGVCDKQDSLVVCCAIFFTSMLVIMLSDYIFIYFLTLRLVTGVGMKPRTSWTVDLYSNYWTIGAGMRVSHIKYTTFLHCTLCQFFSFPVSFRYVCVRVFLTTLHCTFMLHTQRGCRNSSVICYFVDHAQFSSFFLPCFSLLVRWKKGSNVSF